MGDDAVVRAAATLLDAYTALFAPRQQHEPDRQELDRARWRQFGEALSELFDAVRARRRPE